MHMDNDMTDFDSLVKELQQSLDDEAKAAYGDAYDRWRTQPHRGKPPTANCQGGATGSCGDTIWIFLHIENDRVQDAGFQTDGCGSSQISGSMAAELALNKHCEDLPAVTGEIICERLGGLPENDAHCAWLAANALHDAVGDYYKRSLHQTEKA